MIPILEISVLIVTGSPITRQEGRRRRAAVFIVIRVVWRRAITKGRTMGYGANNIPFTNRTRAAACCKPRRTGSQLLARIHNTQICINLHAFGMKLMPTREPHDSADAIHILLKANHAFFLMTYISFPLRSRRAWFLKYRMSRCFALADWN